MDRETALSEGRKQLGDYLTSLRDDLKLTQKQAASRAKLPPTLLSQIESGKRNATEAALDALAAVYGVPANELHKRKIAAEAIALFQASGIEVTLSMSPNAAAHFNIGDAALPQRKWKPLNAAREDATIFYPLRLPTTTMREERALRRDVARDLEALPARHLEKVRAFMAGLRAADAE